MDLHPIQLQAVNIRELFIRTFYPPRVSDVFEPAEARITTETSPFDSTAGTIQIGIRLLCGMDRDPTSDELAEIKATRQQPFRMHIHIVAEFKIDTGNFPVEKIDTWARVNAPALLYPFLREHAFSLTARCGYNPLLLPLVVLPTIRNERPKAQPDLPTVQPELELAQHRTN